MRVCRGSAFHALLDGRDTAPSSALGYVADLERRLATLHPDARIATVGGRYFAMDRDGRWDRVERGYDAIVHAEAAHHAPSASAAIEAAYERGETDEFVAPTVIDGVAEPLGDGDPIIHANFRADRARQLTHALADGAAFDGFDRTSPSGRPAPQALDVVTMTEYEADLPVAVAFPPETRTVASHRRSARPAGASSTSRRPRSTRTSRTSSTAGSSRPGPARTGASSRAPGSPPTTSSPRCAAAGVTDALVEAIGSGTYDFIVANYANPDMVGHTGVWDATIAALATVDACLARVVDAVAAVETADPDGPGALLAITADHGNADELLDADGRPVTAHSLNPVPLVLVGRAVAGRTLDDGVLADVAPTLLELAGLPRWAGMTGRSLLEPPGTTEASPDGVATG